MYAWRNNIMEKLIGIGVDIGGTTIKAAIINEDGTIISVPLRHKTPTSSREDLVNTIIEMILELSKKINNIVNIVVGIGTPGYVDENGYIIGGAPNLPNWRDFNLVDEISNRVSFPVFINNDGSVAAFGEYSKFYKGKIKNMAYLGFGTGVGGGLIINGKLYSGVHGLGTQLGHIIVDPEGMECACGRHGCLETLASSKGMINYAKKIIGSKVSATIFSKDFINSGYKMTPIDIFSYIKLKDPIALELFSDICNSIARACDTIAVILAPEVIVLGGGIMNQGEFILNAVRKYFEKYCMPDFIQNVSIELARSGENSGIIGAAIYAISCHQNNMR
jgi:glucokinase